MRSWMVAFVLVLLAGCSQEADPAGTLDLGDGSQAELKDVKTTATTGAISGVVVDSAIRPIRGVNVTLLGPQVTASTDENGLFTFADLEPGLFTLSAVVPDYLPTQTTAEVVAGRTETVRLVLDLDPTPRPYHVSYKFDAYDLVSSPADAPYEIIRRGLFNDSALPTICDTCTFYFGTDGPVETFVLEAVWEETIPDPTGPTTFWWQLQGDSATGGDSCASPCLVHLPGEAFANDTNYAVSFFPDDTWVSYQQQWTIFVTVWYTQGPPSGWSLVEGDK